MNHDDEKILHKLGRYQTRGLQSPNQSLARLFHENSKFHDASSKMSASRITAIKRNSDMNRMLSSAYKVYSLAETRSLARPEPEGQLEQCIVERRSVRAYTGEPIPLDLVSRLLYFTYGQTQGNGFYRAVASGGALYPLELYIISLRIDGLEPGLYHYDPEQHMLHALRAGDMASELAQCVFLEETDLANACMLVAISAVFARSMIKYGERGYRMLLMECGEAGQNLNLMATANGLGCVWLGGFFDDRLGALLQIDGTEESVLVPIVLGRRA